MIWEYIPNMSAFLVLCVHVFIKCWIVSSDENKDCVVVWLMSGHHLSGCRMTYHLQRVPRSSLSSKLRTLPASWWSGSTCVSRTTCYLFSGPTLKRFFPFFCVHVWDEWRCWWKVAAGWKGTRSFLSLSFKKMIRLSIWRVSKGHLYPIMTHFLFFCVCYILRLENSYKWDFFIYVFLIVEVTKTH